jgi:hypothetical protein
MPNQEIIICSAININSHLFRGNRHHDCIGSAYRFFGHEKPLNCSFDNNQGFITSTGRYVGREEAMKIHKESGVKPFHGEYHHETKLCSEDLY